MTAGYNANKISEARDEMEIDLEEKWKTQSYQETLNIYIENIDKL